MRKIITILVICASLFAYTYEELKQEPKSLAKDYFLYLLLQNNEIKKEDLKEFRTHIYRFAGVMKKEYDKQYKEIEKEEKKPLSPNSCYRFSAKNIIKASDKCQTIRLNNTNFAKNVSITNLTNLAKKYKAINANLSDKLSALASKDPITWCKKHGKGKLLLDFYYEKYKLDDFTPGPKTTDGMLSNANAYKFLNSALVDNKYPLIRAKFAKTYKEDAKQDLAFALGLNALMHNNKSLAEKYFLNSSASYKYKRPRDNALFFAYLASDKKRHLDKLVNSDDLNIYSIYAKELMGVKLPEIIVPNPSKEIDYPISDALKQARFMIELSKASKEKLKEMQEYFNAKNTQGQYLVISEKLSNFKDHIYPIPFPELLKDYDNYQKALILAIAKQESRFLPASVSISYALGMMQFMPFTARYTAKNDFNDNNFDVLNMFKPEIAYKFANAHINLLKKSVDHTAYVAYAYNGGLGFTQRMLKKDYMFSKNSAYKQYEPFLSMDLVPYLESRLYAKKVLANYYIYLKIFNEDIKMQDLFDSLYKDVDARKVQENKK